jgi:hypothetical protein
MAPAFSFSLFALVLHSSLPHQAINKQDVLIWGRCIDQSSYFKETQSSGLFRHSEFGAISEAPYSSCLPPSSFRISLV